MYIYDIMFANNHIGGYFLKNNKSPYKKINNYNKNLTSNSKDIYQSKYKNTLSPKPHNKYFSTIKKIILSIVKISVAIFLIAVISGSILVTSLTVYVMKYLDSDTEIDLRSIQNNYSSVIYTENSDGLSVEVQKLFSTSNRKWVDQSQIPKNLVNAFVATEDERFFQHEGVDWKRTFAAFANLFLDLYSTQQGGSTITQQLIKNITGDNKITASRKIQEIFKSMNLERHYSKDEIIESYLNIIHLGYNTDGVGAAAIYYFNKEVEDLTLIEIASFAAMTRSPTKYDPIKNPENNKNRRKYVLSKMKEHGFITEEEYNQTVDADLVIKKGGTIKNKENSDVQSYFMDALISDIINDLIEKKKYTKEEAESKLYNGGLTVHSTINLEIQKQLETAFSNNATFTGNTSSKNIPQASGIVIDYKGHILGVVGGRGKKEGNRVLNRATQTSRSPGSTIKPLAVYTPQIERNLINWSTILKDSPITITEKGKSKLWPNNYDRKYYGSMNVNTAVQRSINTIPVKLTQSLTPKVGFDFLVEKLGFTTLVESENKNGVVYSDITLSGLSLGGLTYGTTLKEITAAYQIFGNGGNYNKPITYTKIIDSSGKVLLENSPSPTKAIEEDTAGVMNRLLQQVIESKNGTGRAAKMPNTTIIGKTGTSQDLKDQLFIGATPSHISGVWLGHDTPKEISSIYSSPQIWKNIMSPIIEKEPKKDFNIPTSVKKLQYCTSSGKIAHSGCPNKDTGYYRESGTPEICNVHKKR